MTTLNKLKVGQKAIIENITSSSSNSLKLTSLGIMPGDEIEVTGKALFAGPISIKHTNNSFFALRRGHAAQITVKILD